MGTIRARSAPLPNGECLQLDHTLGHQPRPRLTFTDDGPGELSILGPRHDNDYSDYRKIQILPTTDEILAVNRPVYMPKKNLLAENPLHTGMNRHLDMLFRHLRCDSIESIRDICYSAAQNTFLGAPGTDQEAARHETTAGNRYFLYKHVRVEELLTHDHKGMLVRLSYHCPNFMRGAKMYASGRFQEGMLVAILELDHSTDELSVYFMEVNLAQSTMSMDALNGAGLRAAVQLSFPPKCNRDDVHQLARHALRLRPESELVLVEFPKVLYAGFYNCLDRMKSMQEDDVAFSQYVAPPLEVQDVLKCATANQAQGQPPKFDVPAPSYATEKGFAYNLTDVVSSGSEIKSLTLKDLSKPDILKSLQEQTTLDHGQAIAFRDSLSREFAFTQGPPGCGKTFLGVQMTKTLLRSRSRNKPILLVCLTNHALDSFLGDLRDAGVDKLLRIGAGSKEEWTDKINLNNRNRKTRFTREDSMALSANNTHKKETLADINLVCKALSAQNRIGTVSWHYIKDMLEVNDPELHAQFTANSDNPIARAFAFEYWSKGGDLENLRTLHVELASRLAQMSRNHDEDVTSAVDSVLLEISDNASAENSRTGDNSVWNLPLGERQRLLHEWEREVDAEQVACKLTALFFGFQDCAVLAKKIKSRRDAKIMLAHNVIGMTTTACAGRWDQLKSLELDIMICEEAGEVMEAHTLCSLLPTLRHAIFIGDPLQLRPEVNEQALTLETQIGSAYRLDESLLERLMFPKDPALSAVPTSQLDVQRRMHPDIANITRLTYPFLVDHESTRERPLVYGLEKRMYWWDHRVPEFQASDDLKSHKNLHEVDMVSSLVEYLLRGGNYSQGDIAVLTPYSGQLSELVTRLSATCEIWLSDKDREELLAEDLLDLGEEAKVHKDEVAISDMLRVTSVDNFQGEEAKVIILSTVRSGGPAGFLKTLNRINVACSRAREGFYIIGNSQTLSQVPMWRKVISVFNGNIGATITTCCHTHPDVHASITQPSDFEGVQDCPAICKEILDCGHECVEKCHPPALHERLMCQEDCKRTFPCGHKCPKLCYKSCGNCELSTGDVVLACGHEGKQLCSGSDAKCSMVMTTTTLECGHRINIMCGEDPESIKTCPYECGTILPCGHPCPGSCRRCTGVNKHLPCTKVCGWQQPCGHFCKSVCHADKPCPSACPEPCPDFCEHGPCKNRCSDVCDPCVKQPSPTCDHETGSNIICCLPSLSLPCSQRCEKVLPCGHVCPSLHTEPCPPKELCPSCISGAGLKVAVLYMPECGHMTPLPDLDQLNCKGVYNVDSNGTILGFGSDTHGKVLHEPKCTCGVPCLSVHRYSAVAKLFTFSKTMDLLLAKLGRKLKNFANSADIFEKSLSNSLENFMTEIRPNPLAATANTQLLLRRHRDVIDLHKQIVRFRDEVVAPIEQNLRDLHKTIPQFVPDYVTLFHPRFDILEYRATIVRIADDLKLVNCLLKLADPSQSVQRQGLKMLEYVCKQSFACMAYCQAALSNNLTASAPPVDAELRLQQAQFFIFAKVASLKISSLGRGDACFTSPIPTQAIHDSLQKTVNKVGHTFHGRNAVVGTVKAFQDYISALGTNETTAVPMINNAPSRRIEKSWGYHELGALASCANNHVFSKKSFPGGCPGCGISPPPTPKVPETYNTFREADFLKAMYELSAKTNGAPPHPLEKDQKSGDVLSATTNQLPKQDDGEHLQSHAGVGKDVVEIKQVTVVEMLPDLSDKDNKEFETKMHKDFENKEQKALEKKELKGIDDREQKELENRAKFLAAMHRLGI